jgi:hypothetical protein
MARGPVAGAMGNISGIGSGDVVKLKGAEDPPSYILSSFRTQLTTKSDLS